VAGNPGLDRLEREALDFHDRVRAGYRALAESDPHRYLVLDASRPLEELAAAIRDRVLAVLPANPAAPSGPAAEAVPAETAQRGSHDVAEAGK
jgi:hypothetical protein